MKTVFIAIVLFLVLSLSAYGQKAHSKNNDYEFDNFQPAKSHFMGEKQLLEKYGKSEIEINALKKSSLDASKIALNFVRQSQLKAYQENKHVVGAKVVFESESPVGRHIRVIQTLDGIPVFGSGITVSLRKSDGEISSLSSSTFEKVNANIYTPEIDGESAQATAKSYLGISGKSDFEKSELVFFNTKNSGMRLAYHVSIVSQKPMGDWQIMVDAVDRTVIHATDIARYQQKEEKAASADGNGMVWDPDPLTTAGVNYGGRYRDFNDADSLTLNNERISVLLKDLSLSDSGYVLEGPYAKLSDMESPDDTFPVFSDSSAFNFTRSQQGFEAVMVYYHIDKSYRRLMELGYNLPGLLAMKVDPHGLGGDDNSHYIPTTNYLAFGEGGVDDAEDADVIWHEYGHGIQQWASGSMNYSGETMSLMEGASDYWAASYSRSISEFSWAKIFTWDGHNEFWPGRVANLTTATGHYPEDYVSGHNGGQLWSSALMEIWGLLGRDITDKLFIQTHFLWGLSPNFNDAANAFIQADRDLFNGSHFNTIYSVFDSRGMINPDDYTVEIIHTELNDTENSVGPFKVEASIIPAQIPLDTANLLLVYGYDHTMDADTLLLNASDSANYYTALIPGSSLDEYGIWYYFSVGDSLQQITTKPADAPTSTYHFLVKRDVIAPKIVHSPLKDQDKNRWPAKIETVVTDERGIDSVWVEYHFSGKNDLFDGYFLLNPDSTGVYGGYFDFDTSKIETGDSLFYLIKAIDKATIPNLAVYPSDSSITLQFVDFEGYILLVDDEWYADGKESNIVETEKGVYTRYNKKYDSSPEFFQNVLTDAGYSVHRARPSETADLNFDNFDILIHSAGGHQQTISDSVYKEKLFNWSLADSGNKIIFEGGEIGYNWYSDNLFAQKVLHIEDWYADYSGNYVIQQSEKYHLLKSNYFELPDTIKISYSDMYGDQDGLKTTADAYYIYNGTVAFYPGIIVFDPQQADDGARTIFLPFNGVRIDSLTFADLIRNSVDFMIGRINPNNAIGEDENINPVTFELYQNYPNPFNPTTKIRFDLPVAQKVTLKIFNVMGQMVRSLENGIISAGPHHAVWDGKSENGSMVASGIYFYQLKTEKISSTKRMLLIK